MGQRTIRGIIRKPDATWNNARIVFTLFNASFTPSTQYPSTSVVAYANAQGEFTVSLWANEEGAIASVYSCKIEDDDPFEFTIPVGSGDLELSLLRESSAIAPGTPEWTSIINYVDDRIAEVEAAVGINRFEISFTDANLTSANLLVVPHGLNNYPSILLVLDQNNNEFSLPSNNVSPDLSTIDFSFIRPIAGTWTAIARL